MTSPRLFAEISLKAYIAGLRKELDEILERIAEGVELLQKDIWSVNGHLELRSQVERFEELHHELGLAVDEDPEAWVKAMLQEAQA